MKINVGDISSYNYSYKRHYRSAVFITFQPLTAVLVDPVLIQNSKGFSGFNIRSHLVFIYIRYFIHITFLFSDEQSLI